jgi:Carboxypeptidase regulatory-like domain
MTSIKSFLASVMGAMVLASVVSAAMSAQQAPNLGAVSGVIVDPNNNVIRGYTGGFVTLRHTTTNAQLRAEVGLDGAFSFAGVPAGTYDLAAPITGAMYRAYSQTGVVVAAGQTLQLRLRIEWGINLGTFGDDPTMLAKDMARSGEKLSGPAPRTPDGKVDLSGVWVPAPRPGAPPNPFPLQPWAAETNRKLQEVRGPDAQNPGAYCLPQTAIPYMSPFPWKLVQTPTLLIQLTEFFTPGVRQVFMDGRPHPPADEWNPSWHGHSIGRWEGDTLVIETVGYNEVTAGFGIHSEKLKTIERVRRPDLTHLEIEITAEDPEAYTAPWRTTVYGALAPDHEILEFVCPENNKDAITFGGLGWKGRP